MLITLLVREIREEIFTRLERLRWLLGTNGISAKGNTCENVLVDNRELVVIRLLFSGEREA
jgi:hypothetical protein